MERIFEDKGFARRSNISVVVLVVVFIYGIFELWRAYVDGGSDPMGALFGALFIGGSLYGAKTIWDEGRDLITALDADPAGDKVAVTLWRPFRTMTIDATARDLTGWRHWVKLPKRGVKAHVIFVRLAGYPNELHFELPYGKPVADGLRKLAPEAIEDFETNTGASPTAS